MKGEYLPIGSVVLLKDASKRLMVTGFYVKPNASDIYYDYLGCLYPEGIMSEGDNYLFNNEDVKEVCFTGLADDEESDFKKMLYEIIGANESGKKEKGKVISIPVDLYDKYGKKNNDIISIPIDEYNAMSHKKISIPADLYEAACEAEESHVISISADLYAKECAKNSKISKVISIPAELYGNATKKKMISIPLADYNKMLNAKSVISINAKTYKDFLDEDRKRKLISIPKNLYEKLKKEKKEKEIISIPLNVYEKMLNDEKNHEVISIPLDEYERLTNGNAKNGIISLPADVYNEMLRKEKSDIETETKKIIEIPYDMYNKIMLENESKDKKKNKKDE